MTLVYISISIAVLSLLFAAFLVSFIKKQKVTILRAVEISKVIYQGAINFLRKQFIILSVFVILVAIVLLIFINYRTSLAFVWGAIFSILAGNLGMRVATMANARTAQASQKSTEAGLRVALASGQAMGLAVVGLGLLGIGLLYIIFKEPQIIYGFGFGASAVALFARVGGGVFTKAADIGADLVGKVEKELVEDDSRNPAVMADNVGDNVSDVAGMGADLFESYVDSIIAAMVLGVGSLGFFGWRAINFPLFIAALGILASFFGILLIRLSNYKKPSAVLNVGFFGAAIFLAVAAFFASRFFLTNGLNVFWAILAGLVAGILIGSIAEYYTSYQYKPTRKISEASQTGVVTNIISGIALGLRSTILPVLIISITILIAYKAALLYGIALAALGMLSTIALTIATNASGPVADNAAGIAEMAELGPEVGERIATLDATGNTMAAVGKGFAIGSAALTALVLSVSYINLVGLKVIDLNEPKIIVGLFLGGLLPFVFCSLVLRAVGKVAFKVVNEVRRQFKEIVGLLQRKAKPDYNRCIDICAASANGQMILPGLMAIAIPIVIGVVLGKGALASFLIGSIIAGFLLSLAMTNAGGSLDNAKKYIEKGNFGGKGSDSHKAAVIGDTIGDPFKDAAGPSLNILIKLMAIVTLIIAPLL